MSSSEMDIDFDNYTVENERAAAIRSFVESLKASPLLLDLKLLVSELGQEEQEGGGENILPGMRNETVRVFRKQMGESGPQLSITMLGQELKVFLGNVSLLEVSFLPKGNEAAILHFDEPRRIEIEALAEQLTDDVRAAKTKKGERQAAFRQRMEPASR